MPVVRQQEPVLLVRETAESAPSYAFARSVTPSEQGDTATVVAVTREQTRPEDPVRVTLVIATGAAIAEDGKERLP